MAGARGSLEKIDRHTRARTRSKRVARSYDGGAPIALSYSEELAPEPARAWAVAAAAPPAARMPIEWTPPRSFTPSPPARAFGAWSDVTAPSPPRPGTLLPPRTAVPHFTAAEDEAAAAAFAADIGAITTNVAPGEARAADAGEFLARALAEAPRPQPQQQTVDTGEDEEEVAPMRRGHEVFDALTYANQFDAGTVDLDLAAAFDVYDSDLERERRAVSSSKLRAFTQPTPTEFDVIEDLAVIEGLSEIEERREPIAKATAEESFSVLYDVPLVPQQTGYSCWAAGAAMIVAWRDNMSVDPSAIASATGYWEQYKHGLSAEDRTMFNAWRLAPEPAQTYTVDGFRRLLEQWGPLWVASAEPGPHIRVVSGLSGDGTADGTLVHVLDPWEPGMGEFRLPNAGGRYTETYAQFEAKQASLARTESHLQGIYVAHVRDRPTR